MTSSDRVRIIRKHLKLSQQGLADKIGVSRGYINDIEASRAEPSFNFSKKLIDVFNVNLNWLVTGEGSMFRDTDDLISAKGVEMRQLLDAFESMRNKAQEQIIMATAAVELIKNLG